MYITLPPYYPPLILYYRAKAKKRGFSALFALLFAARCVAPLRLFAPSCPPHRGRLSLCLRVSRLLLCHPALPTAAVASMPVLCVAQNGQTDVAARFAGHAVAIFGQDGRQIQPLPPTYPLPPPLWAPRRRKLPPRIFFIFFIFLFSIPPHFIFIFLFSVCRFSVCIVFSFICPFFFDFSRSFVSDDSFPIRCCDMRLNHRFLVLCVINKGRVLFLALYCVLCILC